MLYIVDGSDDAIIDPGWKWLLAGGGRPYCRECGTVKPNMGALDVVVQEPVPDYPIVYAFPLPLSLIRRDLLDAMGEEVAACLHIGEVSLETGKAVASFCAVRARRTIHIRGTKPTGQRICPVCGARLLASLGREHVMACDLPLDCLVFGDPAGRLLLTKKIYERVRKHRWRNTIFRPLQVRHVPADGLPKKLSLFVRTKRRPD